MAVQVEPTRVPSGRVPVRVAAGAVVACLAFVVGMGMFGQDLLSSPSGTPPAASAIAVASASPSPSPTPGDALVRPVPTLPPVSPRGGVATIRSGAATTIAEPASLVPSGVDMLSPDRGAYYRLVLDASGALWGLGGGRLVRIDPVSGKGRAWTIQDDSRFSPGDIATANTGGIWLSQGQTVRRFDGSGFREAYDVGSRIAALATGNDDGVWVATDAGAIVHLVGSRRVQIDALPPDANSWISTLAVDRAGNVWCAWYHNQIEPWNSAPTSWVARFDGRTWRVFDDIGLGTNGGGVGSIAPMPDGSVWVVADTNLTRIDGDRWTTMAESDLQLGYVTAIAADPDGAVWFVSSDPTDNSLLVARLRNGTWTRYGPKDGLPGSEAGGPGFSIAAGRGTFVATEGGIYRLVGSRWRPSWPVEEQPVGPQWSISVVGVTRNEAWTAADGIWHFVNGAWTGPESIGESTFVRWLARSRDGTVWAISNEAGVWVRTSGAWTRLGANGASAVWVDPDGTVWVADGPPAESGPWRVRTYTATGGVIRESRHTASTDLILWPTSMARTPDGSLWVGTAGSWGSKPGLVRYLDGIWEQVRPPGTGPEIAIASIAVATDGALWVSGTNVDDMNPLGASWVARLAGGRWTVFGSALGLQRGYASPLAAAPDGSIWLGGDRLARFDGTSWRTVIEASFDAISVAPDGTVWASGSPGTIRLVRYLAPPARPH